LPEACAAYAARTTLDCRRSNQSFWKSSRATKGSYQRVAGKFGAIGRRIVLFGRLFGTFGVAAPRRQRGLDTLWEGRSKNRLSWQASQDLSRRETFGDDERIKSGGFSFAFASLVEGQVICTCAYIPLRR
jgi:hypothetical protein